MITLVLLPNNSQTPILEQDWDDEIGTNFQAIIFDKKIFVYEDYEVADENHLDRVIYRASYFVTLPFNMKNSQDLLP